MNRKQEYQDLLAELNNTPPALEYAVTRAEARARRSGSIRKFLIIPTGSLITFFIVFVAMVNLSMQFAMACGQIPLLRELAAAVAFSPSLSAAIENKYVQIVGLEQTENGITMRIEYVIVDQKQLNIFYTLHSKDYFHLHAATSIRSSDGSELDWGSISNSDGENKGICQFIIDFKDEDMPDSLILNCIAYDSVSYENSNTNFVFNLTLDPYYTQQGETITLNQDFILDGQRLMVNTVEIYPTHIRVNFADDENNTAWLQSLNFFFVNEKGKRFDPIGNGISSINSGNSPMTETTLVEGALAPDFVNPPIMLSSYRLESSFFSQSRSLTMFITDAVWLDKDTERVKIDLANCTAENLPEGVKLEKSVRKGDSWNLIFSAAEREESHFYELFETDYYDESDNKYIYNSWSFGEYYDETVKQYTPGKFSVKISLEDYPYETVYLSPYYSRTAKLGTPVEIKVK